MSRREFCFSLESIICLISKLPSSYFWPKGAATHGLESQAGMVLFTSPSIWDCFFTLLPSHQGWGGRQWSWKQRGNLKMCRPGSHKIRLHMLDSNAAPPRGPLLRGNRLMSHRLGWKIWDHANAQKMAIWILSIFALKFISHIFHFFMLLLTIYSL